MKTNYFIFLSAFVCALLIQCLIVSAHISITAPTYVSKSPSSYASLDVFVDLLCPESASAWSIVKEAVSDNSAGVTLYPYPQAFHTWSFIVNKGLYVVQDHNESAVMDYAAVIFANQEKFSNEATTGTHKTQIMLDLADLFVNSHIIKPATLFNGLNDRKYDSALIEEIKYGASHGVVSTPSFFLNGLPIKVPSVAELKKSIEATKEKVQFRPIPWCGPYALCGPNSNGSYSCCTDDEQCTLDGCVAKSNQISLFEEPSPTCPVGHQQCGLSKYRFCCTPPYKCVGGQCACLWCGPGNGTESA